MNHEHLLVESRRPFLLLLSLSLFLGVLLFSGAGIAGEVSVPIPSDSVKAGETITVPVVLHDADGIDGFQVVVSELSGGTVKINPTAEHVAGTRFTEDKNQAVLLSTDTPLNGDVTLFSVDVTPVSGKNAIVSVEVYDVMRGEDSLNLQYPGKDTVINVVNGKTEYVKSSANNEVQTTVMATATSVVPLNSARVSSGTDDSSASSSTSSADVPSSPTTKPTTTKTKKSPGFLPLTLIFAGAAVAGYVVLRRRS